MKPDHFFLKLPKRLAIGMVRGYQWTIRPIMGPRCRYFPHCSDYAIDAIEQHGLFSGAWYTACRLGRCHPWSRGGLDPVPPAANCSQSVSHSSQHSLTK